MGSSSYISNLDGEVVQHIEYVPFGEVFLEEKNAKWNTPYLFTSKELDKETGMYYMSARYQDPKLGIFISVDLLAEKYKGWSSYAYTLNNPVNLIDPSGMSADPPTGVDAENGAKHKDSSGSWIYNKASTTWVGQKNKNGERSRDIGNTIELNNVNVKGYKSIYVSSGEYGPSKDFNHALIAVGVVVFPVMIAEGALAGAFALSGEMSTGAASGRALTDASVQTAINFSTNGGDLAKALGDVNITQSVLSGMGMNYVGNALLSSSTNISYNQQVSIFDGTLNAQDFTSQAVFSVLGGATPQKLNNSSWFKGAALGADMYSSVRFGQTAGSAAGKAASAVLTNAPVFGAGVIQKQIPQ